MQHCSAVGLYSGSVRRGTAAQSDDEKFTQVVTQKKARLPRGSHPDIRQLCAPHTGDPGSSQALTWAQGRTLSSSLAGILD